MTTNKKISTNIRMRSNLVEDLKAEGLYFRRTYSSLIEEAVEDLMKKLSKQREMLERSKKTS